MKFKKEIVYSRQLINKSDIIQVKRVLASKYLTQGNFVKKLENKICKVVQGKYCTLVNSGSNALYIACLSLDINKNDLVWTVPITYAATANAAILCGAKIDFVDIENQSFNICINSLKKKLKKKIPKALIVVHLGGLPPDMEEIFKLSKKYNFKIIEDASQSFGAKYKNKYVGSSIFSDITVFSFHPLKTITSGEGGALLTNSSKLSRLFNLFRENGIVKNRIKRFNNYDQIQVGLNFRMSNINAALLNSQLDKFKKYLKIRKKLSKIYDEGLKNLNIKTQKYKKFQISSNHLYIVLVNNFNKKNFNKDKLINVLKKKYNIYTTTHYPSLHKQSYFRKKFKNKKFINSENYSFKALSLPVHPSLKIEEVNKIIQILKKYISKKYD